MKDWTEAFKEKMIEAGSPLPDGELCVLEGLIRRRRQRRIMSWSTMALAMAASVALVLLLRTPDNKVEDIQEYVRTSSPYLSGVPDPPTTPAPVNPVTPAALTETFKKSVKGTSGSVDISPEEPNAEIVDTEEESSDYPGKADSYGESSDKRQATIQPQSIPTYFDYNDRIIRRQPLSSRFSVAFSTGGLPKSKEFYDALNHGLAYPGEEVELTETSAIILDPSQEQISYQYNHHKTGVVTYGVSLRYQLSDRFDLASGINYYGSTSDAMKFITRKDLNMTWEVLCEQKTRYLGVPLHLDWYPLKGNRFSIYVGAGGEARKCVYALRGDERLKDSRIYLSAVALAGLKYEPVRHVGLFVEPQYSYSFLNREPAVKSALTEYPSMFNVKVGLCFDL